MPSVLTIEVYKMAGGDWLVEFDEHNGCIPHIEAVKNAANAVDATLVALYRFEVLAGPAQTN